jgi:hypothetical protein
VANGAIKIMAYWHRGLKIMYLKFLHIGMILITEKKKSPSMIEGKVFI